MTTTIWIPTNEQSPPPSVDGDFGDWVESIEVLIWVAEREGAMIGRLRMPSASCPEWERDFIPNGWVLQGRDGYLVDRVTHWAVLPEGPR